MALMIPLSLNGLWMVCADGEAAPAPTRESQAAAEPSAHCKLICPVEKPDETGAICLLTASADGDSIAVFAIAVATPPAVLPLIVPLAMGESELEPAPIYSNPFLSGLAPPPRA